MPHWLNWMLIAYMGTMIVLFSRFFVRRYMYAFRHSVMRRTEKPKTNSRLCSQTAQKNRT